MVEELLFYRELPVDQISGFEDQNDPGKILTRGFTLSGLSIKSLIEDWVLIKNKDSIPVEVTAEFAIVTHYNFDE